MTSDAAPLPTAVVRALERYTDHLVHELARSPRTVDAYTGDLRALFTWLHARYGVAAPAAVDLEMLRAWLAARHAEGIYAVIDIQAEPAAVAELDRQLNLNESVLRTKLMRPEAH